MSFSSKLSLSIGKQWNLIELVRGKGAEATKEEIELFWSHRGLAGTMSTNKLNELITPKSIAYSSTANATRPLKQPLPKENPRGAWSRERSRKGRGAKKEPEPMIKNPFERAFVQLLRQEIFTCAELENQRSQLKLYLDSTDSMSRIFDLIDQKGTGFIGFSS